MADESDGKTGAASAKGGTGGDPAKAANEAKADAKAAGGQAKQGVASVADEAKRAASGAKNEATKAARDVAESARGEIQGALEEQKAAGAERAQRIAGAIDRAGDELGKEIPMVGEAMHRAAREIEHTATAVRDREPGELVEVAQDFARRQPALFAGAVGLLGFAAVRFLMASPRAGDRDVTGTQGRSPASLPPASTGAGTGSNVGAGTRRPPGSGSSAGGTASGDPGGVSPEAPGLGLRDPK